MYTVIYPNGKVMVFSVKACAELYASINRGTLVCNEILNESEVYA